MNKDTIPLLLRDNLCPGDTVMMTYAVRALAEQYSNYRVGVKTFHMELWQNNPFVDLTIDEQTPGVQCYDMRYDLINLSNQYPVHFTAGYLKHVESILHVKLEPIRFYQSIFMSEEEKSNSPIYRILGKHVPYWVLNAGYKLDYTAKQWDFSRFQQVIDAFPEVFFVQVGSNNDIHPELEGNNLINLVGRTSLREMVNITYHSFGVLTGVSFPMVLAYSLPPNPIFDRQSRAIVVTAGGREPSHWQFPPNGQFLHTCGQLSCCQLGGCWKSRMFPLGTVNQDGSLDTKDSSICVKPVTLPSGQVIAKCMDMISADDVIKSIKGYMDNLQYAQLENRDLHVN